MGVYVDNSRHRYRHMVMCHMVADSLEELHEMAHKIGCRPEWFQAKPHAERPHPHFDLPVFRKERAIALGAQPISQKESVRVLRAWREKLQIDPKERALYARLSGQTFA